MSETFVVNIAGGNTVQNKVSIPLNQAGDGPTNPVLRGLGVAYDVKVTPNVTSFEMTMADREREDERIISGWQQINQYHYRVTGRLGMGQFGVSRDYSIPQRQFFNLRLASGESVVGEEREVWVRDDPEIELFYCGSGLVWCCEAASLVVPNTEGGSNDYMWADDPPPNPPVTASTLELSDTIDELIDGAWPIVLRQIAPAVYLDTGEIATFVEPLAIEISGTFNPRTGEFTPDAPFSFYNRTATRPSGAEGELILVTGTVQAISDPPDGTIDWDQWEFSVEVPYLVTGATWTSGLTGDTGTWYPTPTPGSETGSLWEPNIPGEGDIPGTYPPYEPPTGPGDTGDTGGGGSGTGDTPTVSSSIACTDISVGEAAQASTIQVGPDKIVNLLVNNLNINEVNPLDLPCAVMRFWRDEFNQKHFGGAKYLSIWEDGYDEGEQGPYVQALNQTDITDFDSIRLLQVDEDHEYRLWFRFRSELDDTAYVDKLIRFRLTASNRLYIKTAPLSTSDMPKPSFDPSTSQWSWDTDVFSTLGITDAVVVVDNEETTLPTDAVTPFSSEWIRHKAAVFGGEIKVRFTRVFDGDNNEQISVTYHIYKPGGPATNDYLVVTKWVRQFVASQLASYEPDLHFRFIMPSLSTFGSSGTGAVGDVYLEVLSNVYEVEEAFAYTARGSTRLPVPFYPGMRYNVTGLVEIDVDTGRIIEDAITVVLRTANSYKVLEVKTQAVAPLVYFRQGSPTNSADDVVVPTVRLNYPYIEVDWPEYTDLGNEYRLSSPEDVADPGGDGYFLTWGNGGMKWELATIGSTAAAQVLISDVGSADMPRVFLLYRYIVQGDEQNSIQYLVEYPLVEGYEDVPPSGVVGDNDLGVIYYNDTLVFTRRPANLSRVEVTGGSGATLLTLENTALNVWDWLSIYEASQGSPVLTLTYWTAVDGVETEHGPYPVPEFVPLPLTTVIETPLKKRLDPIGDSLETRAKLPWGRVDYTGQTIQFDYRERFQRWTRWQIVNPLDGTTLTYNGQPANLIEIDISRLFREESQYKLQVGQSLVVTMLHRDGLHVTGLFPITNDWADPRLLTNLRGSNG
jgi:hypothetical protein